MRLPLNIVGSNTFGRQPVMSDERTLNMYIADDFLAPFGGFRRKIKFNDDGEGRGLYHEQAIRKLFKVSNDNLYMIDPSFSYTFVGKLKTYTDTVYIAGNNADQIIISDLENLYVYKTREREFYTLTSADLGFIPGPVTFQDTRFICADLLTSEWRLSEPNNGLSFPFDAFSVGAIETKPTLARGCIPFPGRGNLLLAMGQNVCEQWTDVGAKLFPYQRSQSTNVDYGVINPASIAWLNNKIVWMAVNGKGASQLVFTNGAEIKVISTDGINFELAKLKFPEECHADMIEINGHECYIVTWPKDNLTYMYDFLTDAFFTLTDEHQGAFPARKWAYFENNFYFVTGKDANLYEFRSDYYSYDYGDGKIWEIPMIRICKNIELEDQNLFILNELSFEVQQGQFPTFVGDTDYIPRIDLAISRDNGVNFGTFWGQDMFPIGKRINKLWWPGCGAANTFTPQLRFHSQYSRFLAKNGMVVIQKLDVEGY